MNELSYMAISPDYGLQNGPILGAGEMTNPQFIDSITTIDFGYDYKAAPVTYGSQSFWNDIADTTSDVVKDSSGFVWDTATGTWETVKSGAMSVANAVDDAGTKIFDFAGDWFDNILVRLFLIFVVLVGGVYILAKAGVIRDAAAFVK